VSLECPLARFVTPHTEQYTWILKLLKTRKPGEIEPYKRKELYPHLFVHPPGDCCIVSVQQIVHRRAHQHRQAMRLAIGSGSRRRAQRVCGFLRYL
jgi:hypothetical protein